MDYNSHTLKSIRAEFRSHGVFYTDPKLAEMMRQAVGPCEEVYDPTCGNGNLLAAFPESTKKFGQELNEQQAAEARSRLGGNADIVAGDTLTSPAFIDRKFDAIVANYPFSVKWNPDGVSADDPRFKDAPCLPPPSRADYAFLLQIIYMLSASGVAAVLGAPGILFRGQREGRIRKWLIEKRIIESITMIEGGYFTDTNISTALIVFRKGSSFDSIRFADHETGKSVSVSVEDVLANGSDLTPSRYIPVESEPAMSAEDYISVEREARESLLKVVRNGLEFSKLNCETMAAEGLPDSRDLARKIIKIAQEYVN